MVANENKRILRTQIKGRSQRTVSYFVNFIKHLEQKLFFELFQFDYFLVKASPHIYDQIACF